MPANDSDNDNNGLCNSIRRRTDFCDIFRFEHNADIKTSKSRIIAIGDIATLADISLSTPY